MKRKWMGKKPVTCEICGHRFDDQDRYFFDFAMRQGKWALGCEPCFKKHGVGLGSGSGQKYSIRTMDKVEDRRAIKPVGSLNELRHLAETDDNYKKLLCVSSSNLGGPSTDVDKCYRWLMTNALETTETGVVNEVNGCIGLLP